MTVQQLQKRRRGAHFERGSLSLEVAIVAPLLLLTLMMIVQYAMVAHAQSGAQAAAEEGAAAARAFNGTSGQAEAQAEQYLTDLVGGTLSSSSISATRSTTEATVTITGTVKRFVPLVPVTFTRTSTGPVERFVEEVE